MSYWIFQGKPSRYDVSDIREGAKEVWLVTRFREEMKVGDIVYLWRAGEESKRGIYGWGLIADKPKHYKDWGWGIPVYYKKRFPAHLESRKLKQDPILQNNLLFRMPIGTNFEVSEKEAQVINKMIAKEFGPNSMPKEGV